MTETVREAGTIQLVFGGDETPEQIEAIVADYVAAHTAIIRDQRAELESAAEAADGLTAEEQKLLDAKRQHRPDIAAQIFGLRNTIELRATASAPANDNRKGGAVYPGIVSSADFVKGFAPPDYHLDGVAQAGFLYALTAGTGTGKTAVLLALTASTALGTSLCGREVRRGRVIYFAGENPDDVRMRWLAMAHHGGFDPADMDVHFIAGTFSIPAAVARIGLDVERLGGADMIVVDTSAAYFQGDDENGNTALGKHARDLRALTELPGKPAVFVACHPTKNPDPTNLQPRGGGAFIAEVDGNLVLTKDTGFARLHWQVKHRGADFAPLFFALQTVTAPGLVDSRGRPVPTVMAVGVSDFKPKKSGRAALKEPAQKALAALHASGGSLELESWRKAFYAEYPDDEQEARRKRFQRARGELEEVGAVEEESGVFNAVWDSC